MHACSPCSKDNTMTKVSLFLRAISSCSWHLLTAPTQKQIGISLCIQAAESSAYTSFKGMEAKEFHDRKQQNAKKWRQGQWSCHTFSHFHSAEELNEGLFWIGREGWDRVRIKHWPYVGGPRRPRLIAFTVLVRSENSCSLASQG